MRSLYSWFLVILMIIFWIFRIVIAFTASLDADIGIEPIDLNIEIILLFVTLVSIIFVIKRKIFGGILYLISYSGYFGIYLFRIFPSIIEGTAIINEYIKVFFSFIGMLLSILILFDILLDKKRKLNPKDKKTDWFYKNKEFDRNIDERADKNNYRIL